MPSFEHQQQKVVVVLPCHNQEDTVNYCTQRLLSQTVKPYRVLVIDDHSTTPPVVLNREEVILLTPEKRGRSSTRNFGIEKALEFGADIIVFMDGDTYPQGDDFLKKHLEHHSGSSLVFGMRRHIPRPFDFLHFEESGRYVSRPVNKLPSDLLTGNMDNLYLSKGLDHSDLRIISGTVGAWADAKSFDEKCDLLLTGMVSWSCNFSMSRDAATVLRTFIQENYNIDGWFDDCMFNDGWGYEDVAMGVDAHFAGIDIKLVEGPLVCHFMHDRSDELFAHIKGRHRIMTRYRKLMHGTRGKSSPTKWDQIDAVLVANGKAVGITRREITIHGRSFPIPPDVRGVRLNNSLLTFRGKLYLNGYLFNPDNGSYKKSWLGALLNLFA